MSDSLPGGWVNFRRRFLPKWVNFARRSTVTDAQVKAVQDRTDARPRKALGYLTPEEAFRKARPP